MAKTDVTTDELFARIGRQIVQLQKQDEQLLAFQQQNAEFSRAAGEALRALEALGRKEIANAIIAGKPWHLLLAPPAAEEADAEVVAEEATS